MTGVLRAEWIKLRTVRSTWATLAAALGLTLMVAILSAAQGIQRGGVTNLSALTGGIGAAALVFGALGVQAMGIEYRHATIRPTFTAVPRRWQVLLAKLAVVLLLVSVSAAGLVAVSWVIGITTVPGFRVDATDQRLAIGLIVFCAGMTVAGFGVGCIVRQPVAGVLGLLVDAFMVERLLLGLLPSAAPWLPFANGFQMTLRFEGHTPLRPLVPGGAYFLAVSVGLTLVGAILTERRDA